MSEHSDEHPNVALVRQSFLRAEAGDIEGAMQFWAPGARLLGFDADGHEAADGTSLGDVMRIGQQLLAHHENELVDLRPVGQELVIAHLRTTGESRHRQQIEAEYVIVLTVRDGQIQWACDFTDSTIQSFLDDAWSGPTDI